MTYVMVQSLLCKLALKLYCYIIHFPSHLFIHSFCMLESHCKQTVLRLNVRIYWHFKSLLSIGLWGPQPFPAASQVHERY